MGADSGAPPKLNSTDTVGTRPEPDNLPPLTVQISSRQASTTKSAVWLRRASVLLFVTFSAIVGVLLVLLPWSLQWTANRWLWPYPDLRAVLGNAFVRGACSGLGLLNLWIGFREAVHYHEGEGAVK